MTEETTRRGRQRRGRGAVDAHGDLADLAPQPADGRVVTSEADHLWNLAIARQDRRAAAKGTGVPAIALPPEPSLIAFPSDLHIGSADVDYRSLLADTELIAETPGAHAVFVGDGTDNWIIGKLVAQQRHQTMPYDEEVELFADWLRRISPKLRVVVSGNHDLWTHKIAGLDPLKDFAGTINALYGRHHVVFDLQIGSYTRRVLVRHKWRGSSVFNPTHGLEVGWERGDIPYDWAVGGHTHVGTLLRAFDRHDKRRYAILIGTYKLSDAYGDELGLPSPKGRGCGAMVVHPDGRQWWMEELREGVEFLAFLRQQAGIR
jgi:hypothetical protein